METYITTIVNVILAAGALAYGVRILQRWARRPAIAPPARRRRATPILQPLVEERVRPRFQPAFSVALQPDLPEVTAEIEWALDERTERDVVNPIVRERERAEALDQAWFGDLEMPTPGAQPISAAGAALKQKYGR